MLDGDTGLEEDSRASAIAESLYEPINLAVDVLFLVDIVISFRTGFWQDGLYIKTPEHVARHYLYGEFRLDFIAAFPYAMVAEAS